MRDEDEAGALAMLSGAEREDLARFGRPELRRRALVAHAAQRAILGHYLGAEPAGLTFELGAWGKPRLSFGLEHGRAPLRFNLSHSCERALLAVTRTTPVGIDVEQLRTVRRLEELAQRYLAPDEQRRLLALPEGARAGPFLRLWVGKEALAKATGEGLQFGLCRIALDLAQPAAEHGPLRLAAIDGRTEAAAGWTLLALDEPGGYAAAVAAPRAGMRVRRRAFEPAWGVRAEP